MAFKYLKTSLLRGSGSSNRTAIGVTYLLSEKISKLIIGLIVHSFLARYLSPVMFGEMGYIINFATAFLPVTLLGLEDVGVRRIVDVSDEVGNIVYEIFIMRIFSLFLVIISSGLFLTAMSPQGSKDFFWIAWGFCSIYNFIGIFFTFEIPFLSQVSNRPLFISRLFGYASGTTLKLIGIFQGWGFLLLLSTYLIEEIVGKLVLIRYYLLNFRLIKHNLKFKNLYGYVKPSFWIVTGSFMMILENKLGFFVIEKFNDDRSLGFFTASFMLVDLWVFVPIALLNATLPLLVKLQKLDVEKYRNVLKDIHGLFFGIQVLFVIGVWVIAPSLIKVLYGDSYAGAEYFLRWQSLSVFFTFVQILRMRWFLIEEKIKIWTWMNGLQLIFSFVLMYYFRFGKDISGVVLSSMLSFLMVNLMFGFKFEFIRKAFACQLLSPIYAFNLIKKTLLKFQNNH